MNHRQLIYLWSFVLLWGIGCSRVEVEVAATPLANTITTTKIAEPIFTETPTTTSTPLPTQEVTTIPTATPVSVVETVPTLELAEIARWGQGVIGDVAFSPDGRWVAVGTSTGIYLHNAHNLEETPLLIASDKRLSKITFSPDNTLIAAVDSQHVYLWRVADQELLETINGPVENITFSPDGKLLALQLASYIGESQLWSIADGAKIRAIASDGALAFSPAEPLYAVTNSSKGDFTIISIYQLPDQQLLKSIEIEGSGFNEGISSLAFSQDGQLLFLGKGYYGLRGDTGVIEVRDFGTGEVLYKIESIAPRSPRPYVCDSNFVSFEPLYAPVPISLTVSPDNQHLLATYREPYKTTVVLYSLADGQLEHMFETGVNSAAYSPDGHSIITGSEDGRLYLWEADTLSPEQTISNYSVPIEGIAFAPNGELMVTESKFGVQLYEAADGALINEFPTAVKAAFAPDNIHLAVGYADGHIELHDLVDKTMAYEITEQSSPLDLLSFTPNGQYLVAMSQDCSKNVYQAVDGAFVRSLEDLIAEVDPVGETRLLVGSLAFSHDGRKIVGDFTTSLQFGVWEMDTGELIGLYPEEESAGVRKFMALPNKELFVARGGMDSTTEFSFWQMDDISLTFELNVPDRGNYYYQNLAISPDGELLATSTGYGTIDVWHIDSQKLVSTLLISTYVREVDTLFTTALAFSPDGRYLVAGTDDGLVHLWMVP